MDLLKPRQQEKAQQSQQDPGQKPKFEPDDSDQDDRGHPSQSDLDDIEKKMNQGTRDRGDQLRGDSDSGSGTDMPW